MATLTVPGPTNRELLGKISYIQTEPIRFLMDLSQRFGGVARFQVFNLPVFSISHPDGVRHVLQEENRLYSKDTFQYNALSAITGRGLLTNDGASWLRQRRLAQPAFARQRLQALDQIVVPATRRMLDAWESHAKSGQPLDVDREMMRLTLEVVGQALFSIDLSQEASQITQAVLTTLDHIVYKARNMIVPPEFIPTPRNLHFNRSMRVLDRAVYGLIAERRRSGQTGEDLLGMFLAARDEETGQPMSDRLLRDEVMTMLVAGHETVASALTWSWMLLAQTPHERDLAIQEVREVLGDRPPTSADLPSLPRVANIFSEALRLYPPAWIITRKAVQPDQVMGFEIPQNALVIISPYVVHRQEAFWPDPETFQPDRFAQEPSHRHAYLPFGAGPRLCIGNSFAQIEAQLILAQVLQRYSLDLVAPPPKVESLVTLRPQGGLPMRIHPADS